MLLLEMLLHDTAASRNLSFEHETKCLATIRPKSATQHRMPFITKKHTLILHHKVKVRYETLINWLSSSDRIIEMLNLQFFYITIIS